MIQRYLKSSLDQLLSVAAFVAAAFLAEQLIVAVVMLTLRPDSTVVLCPVLLPMMAGPVSLLTGLFRSVSAFETMVRFSVTRRTALLTTLAVLAASMALGFAAAGLLGWLDGAIAVRVWLARDPELFVEVLSPFPWWGILGAMGLLLMLTLALMAAAQRFGTKAFWTRWAVWMVLLFLLSSGALDALEGQTQLLLPLLLLLALADVWAVWSLLHAAIRR